MNLDRGFLSLTPVSLVERPGAAATPVGREPDMYECLSCRVPCACDPAHPLCKNRAAQRYQTKGRKRAAGRVRGVPLAAQVLATMLLERDGTATVARAVEATGHTRESVAGHLRGWVSKGLLEMLGTAPAPRTWRIAEGKRREFFATVFGDGGEEDES